MSCASLCQERQASQIVKHTVGVSLAAVLHILVSGSLSVAVNLGYVIAAAAVLFIIIAAVMIRGHITFVHREGESRITRMMGYSFCFPIILLGDLLFASGYLPHQHAVLFEALAIGVILAPVYELFKGSELRDSCQYIQAIMLGFYAAVFGILAHSGAFNIVSI